MSDPVVVPSTSSAAALSQGARLADTFFAPGKAFADIRRSASFWLPWLLSAIVALGFCFTVQQKVGWEKAYDNILRQSPKQMERMDQMPPAQAEHARAIGAKVTQYIALANPLLGLVVGAIVAGVLLATLNFGFGGQAKFAQLYAVWFYATLPLTLGGILAIIALFAGLNGDAFNLQNPIGTNIAYYLPGDAPHWLSALLTSIDLLTLWTLVLLSLGCAAVAQIKKSAAATAVFGWWILLVFIKVGMAALNS